MQSVTALDVLDWVAGEVGHAANGDEGVTFGSPRRAVHGISVCWMPDADAIRAAAAAGHDLLVHHEALTYPYPALTGGGERHYLGWDANVARLKALTETGITTARVHGSADRLCVNDAFVRALGLGEPASGAPPDCVYEIPPTPYAELVVRVKTAFGMSAVRATCVAGPDRIVRRVGTAGGGTGLFVNVASMQRVIEHGIDAMIAGESDNYGMRFCAEAGVDLVETSHELSEQPGLAVLVEKLTAAFPQLPVTLIPQEAVWRMM